MLSTVLPTSGFPIHGQHKYWIENGHSKIIIVINIMWGGGGENYYTLCGAAVHAGPGGEFADSGKCNIKCNIN
jgi:hypothetical protein